MRRGKRTCFPEREEDSVDNGKGGDMLSKPSVESGHYEANDSLEAKESDNLALWAEPVK